VEEEDVGLLSYVIVVVSVSMVVVSPLS
jgi:hypothetical protein